MKPVYWIGYGVVGLLLVIPAGIRFATWPAAQEQPVDSAMAQTGHMLFVHEWTPNDPLARGGDGLGPVFNASSCVECHHQGGAGGSGGVEHNVTTFTVEPRHPGERTREGVVHSRAVKFPEMLSHVHPSLPAISNPSLAQLVVLPTNGGHCLAFPLGIHLSQRNTPALFGAKLIDEIPERVIIAMERSQRLKSGLAPADTEEFPVGRVLRLADGRIGRFGWKGQTASLADFVQAACANELGLGNPGQAQPRPLGKLDYQPPGLDLTLEQCNQLTAFVASLNRPEERLPDDPATRDHAVLGKKLFRTIGCAACHTPDLGGVEGIFSDLLLHRMGAELQGGGSYDDEPPPPSPGSPGGVPDNTADAPHPNEWRTPPLWGVADSAPYLHDGRAATLEEAIQLHGGQGTGAARRFRKLSPAEQAQLVAFLKTLRAPVMANSVKPPAVAKTSYGY